MAVIPNKWVEKQKKKKVLEPIRISESEKISQPHITVARSTMSRTLRGVRK